MFWKKKEEIEEPSSEEYNFDEERVDAPSFERPRMSQALSKLSNIESTPQTDTLEKDIQLILAKLDTIQHMLDNLNQRVKHIEKIAEEE